MPEGTMQNATNMEISSFETQNENQAKRKYRDAFNIIHISQPEKKQKPQEHPSCRRQLFADRPGVNGYFVDRWNIS